MSGGCLMLDVAGTSLTDPERDRLSHPHVGGLILFARNYDNPSQLADLVAEIRAVNPDIVIAVDQEGGRVQRFREGFSRLPSMFSLVPLFKESEQDAVTLAQQLGYLMASELVMLDIDISFAPVLDLNLGRNTVIGDRAFGETPEQIIALAGAFMKGMHRAGMSATGKHFPGHGWVSVDSHVGLPTDERAFDQIDQLDMQPFKALIDQGLDAIMPAHVVYEQIVPETAGFSSFWLQDQLRKRLGFDGIIFSDDLSMEGAAVAGGYEARAEAALHAGCDMVLVCNTPDQAERVLHHLDKIQQPMNSRVQRIRKKPVEIDQDELALIKSTLSSHPVWA